MLPRTLVLADDLTGANDTAVQFADNGFNTLLTSSVQELVKLDNSRSEVVAINAATRPSYAKAEETTRNLTEQAIRAGFEQIYLKVDSTMRGSVAQQIKGAIAGLGNRNALAFVCTAYPEMGRVINDEVLYVDGIPVTETRSGRDPITPVKSSRIGDLIPDSFHVRNHHDVDHCVQEIIESTAQIITFDARVQEDLEQISEVADRVERPIVFVGSAGLAQALIGKASEPKSAAKLPLPIDFPPLVVVTSIHDVSQAQVDEYISDSAGVSSTVFSPAPAQLTQDPSMPSLLRQISVLSQDTNGVLVLRANPTVTASIEKRTQVASDFANKLSLLTKKALQSGKFGSLIIFGGDGSAACFKELSIANTQVLGSIEKGVPLSIVVDGPFEKLPIVTKSGGFGEPNLLINIVNQIWKGISNE